MTPRRRAVETLTNIKGAEKPIFEHDFPLGSDIIGESRNGLKAAEKVDFELFDRLSRHMEV